MPKHTKAQSLDLSRLTPLEAAQLESLLDKARPQAAPASASATPTGPAPLTASEAGRMGGLAVKAKHPPGYFRELGSKGGRSTKARHPPGYFQELATEGGVACREAYGRDHFSKIGKKGAQATKQRLGLEHYAKIGRAGGLKRQALLRALAQQQEP